MLTTMNMISYVVLDMDLSKHIKILVNNIIFKYDIYSCD